MYQPEQGPEHDVKPHARFHLKTSELRYSSCCSDAHIEYWFNIVAIFAYWRYKASIMWSRILFTHQTIKIMLLSLPNSWEMLMRTCRLSASPGCGLEPVLALGASHVWGASLGLISPWESLRAVCSCWHTSLSPFPQNVVYLLLLLPDALPLISYAKPNLKVVLFIFLGLKPQILLSSSSTSTACIRSEEFLFKLFCFLFLRNKNN